MGLSNYFLICLLPLILVICAADNVPVLIWGNGVKSQNFPGLQRFTTDEFLDIVLKKVRSEHPLILLFVEENLSIEDLSWRDADDVRAFQNIQNISSSSGGMTFLTSVQNPYHSLRQLPHHGYSWKLYNQDTSAFNEEEPIVMLAKLKEPSYMDDRPDMLRKHDEQMAEIYNSAQESGKKVVAIYTGHHSSWMDADTNRVKRQEPKEPKEAKDDDPSADDSPIAIADTDMNFMVYVTGPIVYTDDSGAEKKLVKVIGTPTTSDITDGSEGRMLDVKMAPEGGSANDNVDFDMVFIGAEGTGFTLSKIQLEDSTKTELFSNPSVYGPRGYSYYCSEQTVFKNNKISMTFTGLQVQGFVQDSQFGRAIDCIPYFSPAIWSGLLVILLLGGVTAWGTIMIMDINTNDRFDDPKGKTITISALD